MCILFCDTYLGVTRKMLKLREAFRIITLLWVLALLQRHIWYFEAHLFVTRWPGSRCDGRDWFRQQCERFSSREKTACLVSERSGWVRIWILLETVQIGHFRVSTNLCFKARLIQSFWSETHASKTHLHKKGSALNLVLKVRVFIIMTNESIELIPFAWILNPKQSQHMRPKLTLQELQTWHY